MANQTDYSRARIIELYDVYSGALTEKQRSLMEQHYFDDLSYYEIAENEGVTASGVRDVVIRACAKITKLEESLGVAEKFAGIRLISAEAPENSALQRILEIIGEK